MITFNRDLEEEEAWLIIRENKMGATEDQDLTIQRRSLKRWGIWRTQLLKSLLSILKKKWCCYEWRRWWRWKESTHETNKHKYSIFISWYCFVIHLIIFSWCIFCINDCILLICMWWVSSSWCYTTLHCYLSNLFADILD